MQIVPKLARIAPQEVEDRRCFLAYISAFTLELRVAKERTEQLRVDVGGQLNKISGIELEVAGELSHKLVNTVQPLKENGTAFVGIGNGDGVSAAIGHFVAVVEPVLFDEHLEPFNGAVIRVE